MIELIKKTYFTMIGKPYFNLSIRIKRNEDGTFSTHTKYDFNEPFRYNIEALGFDGATDHELICNFAARTLLPDEAEFEE